MPRVDYAAAYQRLQAWVATEKSGYGRQELLQRMAEFVGEYTVSEEPLAREVRIRLDSGVAVVNPAGEEAARGRAEPAPEKLADPGPPTSEGGHDGSRHREEAVGATARR